MSEPLYTDERIDKLFGHSSIAGMYARGMRDEYQQQRQQDAERRAVLQADLTRLTFEKLDLVYKVEALEEQIAELERMVSLETTQAIEIGNLRQQDAALLAAKDAEIGRLQHDLLGTERALRETGGELAEAERTIDTIRNRLFDEPPTFDELDRWLYGGDGLP